MSDIKYVFADDGELYPVPKETVELPAWLNLDDDETEDVIPKIKVSLKKPTELAIIPKVEKPEVEDWRTKTSWIRKTMIGIAENPEIVGMALFLCFFLSLLLNGGVTLSDDNSLKRLGIYVGILMPIPIATYIINRIFLLSMKNNYLSKRQPAWIVNYLEERIEAVTISRVYCPGECFNNTEFVLNEEFSLYDKDETFTLCGEEIYLSENDAKQMLIYVQNCNDRAISEYYPEWKSDSNFVKYYKKRIPTIFKKEIYSAGSGRSPQLYCDGKHFVREYINEIKKEQKKHKQELEEKAAMMKDIQRFKN